MTVDTAAVPENKKTNLSITKRDRRDVIRQVREITGLDENAINQTIEACKDGTGKYSLEQVISLLFDDSHVRNNLQRSPQSSQNPSPSNANLPVQASAHPTYDRNNPETITDEVIEISPEMEHHSGGDDDLERALQLSRETMEQIIDESDIAERKSLDEPAGLKNIGNTCWFNSVVQVLYTLPYFRHLIFNFQYSTVTHSLTESEQQAIAFTEELRSLFVLMLKSPRRSINPDRALKKFKNTRKLCGVDFSQEDCSEFAIHLIDLVELAYETVGKSPLNIDNSMATNFINPINTLVTGEVVVERNEYLPIREALRQINIQMIDSSNLYDGLESLWLGSADETFASPEVMNEQRWLTRLPPVLFICLNRYRFSQITKQTSKIIAPFEFYPELFLDRYMLNNKKLVLHKRTIAKTLYAQLHELENTLNSYLKYPCNEESFALANAIRVIYEFATGRRLNPTPPKRSESMTSDSNPSIRPRNQPIVPIHPSHISPEELQFIQNTLPTWLTEIEGQCAQIREEIRRVKNELKGLYDESQLKQTRYTLHAVCVHEGTVNLGHFWTYVHHPEREKWYRYNDNEVCETTWNDVFDTGIGSQRTQSDREEPRVPSAYLLVYISADQKALSRDLQSFELAADLQRILDDDLVLLQQQIETMRLEQLHNQLKTLCDHIEKQPVTHPVLALPFFTGPNATSDSELVKPVLEPTLRLIKHYAPRILTVQVDRLLQEMIEREMKTYAHTANMITSVLPHHDLRLQHILSYFSANRIEPVYLQRVMYDILRLTPVPNDDLRAKIFKLQAQIIAHDMEMSNDEAQEYQKLLIDYKDFRSVIAAFLAGCQLMNEDKFEDAITYFCVACEYNLRLSKQCTLPMRGMDSCLLFKARRLCFERWNDVVISRFKSDPEYRLDTMTHKFLPCLMQLKLSSEGDQAYISEIQKIWCLLLDKLEPTERSLSLEEFLQRLLEQPVSQHYHSVSINKHQLVERYDETVRDLQLRYPSFVAKPNEPTLPQASPIRSNRTTSLPTPPVSIPLVIQQQAHRSMDNPSEVLPVADRSDSSPMRQGDLDESLPLP